MPNEKSPDTPDLVLVPCPNCEAVFNRPTDLQAHLMDEVAHRLSPPLEVFNPVTRQFERNNETYERTEK